MGAKGIMLPSSGGNLLGRRWRWKKPRALNMDPEAGDIKFEPLPVI